MISSIYTDITDSPCKAQSWKPHSIAIYNNIIPAFYHGLLWATAIQGSLILCRMSTSCCVTINVTSVFLWISQHTVQQQTQTRSIVGDSLYEQVKLILLLDNNVNTVAISCIPVKHSDFSVPTHTYNISCY